MANSAKYAVAMVMTIAVSIAIFSVGTLVNSTTSSTLAGAAVLDVQVLTAKPYSTQLQSFEGVDTLARNDAVATHVSSFAVEDKKVRERKNPNREAKVEQTVVTQLRNDKKSRVIVTFKQDVGFDSSDVEAAINAVASGGQEVVRLKEGFATEIDAVDFDLLASNELIDMIYEDRPVHTATAESFPLIKHDDAINSSLNGGYGVDGEGYIVCSIDSGVSYGHNVFGSCNYAQILAGTCAKFLPGGYNLYDNNNNIADDYGHGTAMMGIIAGDGTTYKGIAPKAKILAYKITDNTGAGWLSYFAQAMQYCMDNTTDPNKTIMMIGVTGDFKATSFADCEGDARL